MSQNNHALAFVIFLFLFCAVGYATATANDDRADVATTTTNDDDDDDDEYLFNNVLQKLQIHRRDFKKPILPIDNNIFLQLPRFSTDRFIFVVGSVPWCGLDDKDHHQGFYVYDIGTYEEIGNGVCSFGKSQKEQILNYIKVNEQTNMGFSQLLERHIEQKNLRWGEFSLGNPVEQKGEGTAIVFRGTSFAQYRWNYGGTKSALRGSGEILTALDNFLISVETNKLLHDKMISPEKYQAMRARLDAKLAADRAKEAAQAAERRKIEEAEAEKRRNEARAQLWEEQKNEPGLPMGFHAAHAGAVQRLKDKFFPGAAVERTANPRSGRHTPQSLGAALKASAIRARTSHANCVVFEGVVNGAPVTVGLYHGLSPADAAEGLVYLRLTFCRQGEPDGRKSPEYRARTLRECPLKLGDRCFSGSGKLMSDMRPRGQSAESELYFFLGNTVAMVVGDDPEESVYPVAQKLETLLKSK